MSEPTNADRANRIVSVMHDYCQALEGRCFNDDDGDITDLLTDLMHFCEQKSFNFNECLRMSRIHYEAEKENGSDVIIFNQSRIIVEVRGGLVCAVYSNDENVNLSVLDWDVQEEPDSEEVADQKNEFEALEYETRSMAQIY